MRVGSVLFSLFAIIARVSQGAHQCCTQYFVVSPKHHKPTLLDTPTHDSKNSFVSSKSGCPRSIQPGKKLKTLFFDIHLSLWNTKFHLQFFINSVDFVKPSHLSPKFLKPSTFVAKLQTKELKSRFHGCSFKTLSFTYETYDRALITYCLPIINTHSNSITSSLPSPLQKSPLLSHYTTHHSKLFERFVKPSSSMQYNGYTISLINVLKLNEWTRGKYHIPQGNRNSGG